MRLLVALVIVLVAYSLPIDDGLTTLDGLRYKSYLSVFLGVLVIAISWEWWAISIAVVEVFLILINLVVAANWQGHSIFDDYYSNIQDYALLIELLIIYGALPRDGIDYRRLRSLFNSLHSSGGK